LNEPDCRENFEDSAWVGKGFVVAGGIGLVEDLKALVHGVSWGAWREFDFFGWGYFDFGDKGLVVAWEGVAYDGDGEWQGRDC